MRTALTDFITSLDRIRELAGHIIGQAPAALNSHVVLRRHETMQFASTVMLSGYFESFLRDLARAFVREVCVLQVPFTMLPRRVRESHYEEGGKVLTGVAKAERTGRRPRFQTTSADISERLRSVSHPPPYELVWEAFADTGSNPGPGVVADFARRMDVEDVWNALETKAVNAANTYRTGTWMRQHLTTLIELRNECAHTGAAGVQVLPTSLQDYCEVLEVIATSLVEVLEDQRAQLQVAQQAAAAPNPPVPNAQPQPVPAVQAAPQPANPQVPPVPNPAPPQPLVQAPQPIAQGVPPTQAAAPANIQQSNQVSGDGTGTPPTVNPGGGEQPVNDEDGAEDPNAS